MDIYKNEYWSRVITVDTHNPDESRRWPLALDLSEQHEIIFTIDEDDLPKMLPYYDPAEFIKRYPQPQVGAFRLSDSNLEQVAKNVT